MLLTRLILITIKQWRITAIVYFFQFCLALTLGLQVLSVFESSVGKSLEINKLLAHYDYTVMSDFLKTHGASISPLIGELRWLLLIYALFAIFIDAGLLVSAGKASTEQPNVKTFWQGGANYFFAFLKVAALFFSIALLWTLLIFVPIGAYFQPALLYFPNEKYAIYGIFIGLVVWLIGLCGLFLWSVATRVYAIRRGAAFGESLKNGWRIFRSHQKRFWRLLCLCFGVQVVLFLIYWNLDAFLGMTSAFFIVFMLLLQQLFSFLRIAIRQMFYAGGFEIGA